MSYPLSSADRFSVDDGFSRRLKALATTAPMHDLDARKVHLDWPDAQAYQMSEIAFQIIDQVTIAMDFDRGADHREVIRRVLPFVAIQAPDSNPGEHERAARWVLENLINVGTADRGFSATYGAVNAAGVYEKKTWTFKLLRELYDADGNLYLRSTDEAINVLVGALDTDVESAQAAAERKLRNLIRRGRLSDAKNVALEARWRTSQYAEQLRLRLDATRRDVRAVDWVEDVPNLIKTALDHIEQRARVENAILINITAARDDADDPDQKRKAAELVEIVRDCLRRHDQLQARLMEAGDTFRAEQDRQEFSGPPREATVDLYGQLLRPTLELALADAALPTAAFFRAATGLAVTGVPRLLSLVHMLLTPTVDRSDLGEPVPEPDLAPPSDPSVFSEQQWEAADRLLAVPVNAARRLSALLAEARAIDPALPHLIAMRALHALKPAFDLANKTDLQTALIAVDDGTPLHDPEFGGTDLLVGTATLSASIHTDQHPEAVA